MKISRCVIGRELLYCGPVRVKEPFWLVLIYYLLLRRDAAGFLKLGLLASVWHELGHIICYRLLCGCWPVLTVSVMGIALHVPARRFGRWERCLLAAAGPLFNGVAAAVALLWAQNGLTVRLAAWGSANLLLGGFNLLPISPLDGFEILCALLPEKLHFFSK